MDETVHNGIALLTQMALDTKTCRCNNLPKRQFGTVLANANTNGVMRDPICPQCHPQKNLKNSKIKSGKENIPLDVFDKGDLLLNSKITPKKNAPKCDDPDTPTANLKMLVCAASILPAFADVDKGKKDLFNEDPNGTVKGMASKVNEGSESCFLSEEPMESASSEINLPLVASPVLTGRKEKSLGLLCRKFMKKYPEYAPNGHLIFLDDVATHLNIGRRRVYDIVNVLESMEMMTRQAKNKYIWFGKSRLPITLTKLKALALRVYGPKFCHILKKFDHIGEHSKILTMDYVEVTERLQKLKTKTAQRSSSDSFFNESVTDEEFFASMCDTPDTNDDMEVDDVTCSIMDSIISYDVTRRDASKSLGILCQKFLMLFMVAKDHTVTLDRAAKILIDVSEEGAGKYKTKVRRLYDIANILSSIGFLEKCFCFEDATKKAAYKWIGIDIDSLNTKRDTKRAFQEQEFSLTRHSLLVQFPTKNPLQCHRDVSDHQRKMKVRSASAHQLGSGATLQRKGKIKIPRTFSASEPYKLDSRKEEFQSKFDCNIEDTSITQCIEKLSPLAKKPRVNLSSQYLAKESKSIVSKSKVNSSCKPFTGEEIGSLVDASVMETTSVAQIVECTSQSKTCDDDKISGEIKDNLENLCTSNIKDFSEICDLGVSQLTPSPVPNMLKEFEANDKINAAPVSISLAGQLALHPLPKKQLSIQSLPSQMSIAPRKSAKPQKAVINLNKSLLLPKTCAPEQNLPVQTNNMQVSTLNTLTMESPLLYSGAGVNMGQLKNCTFQIVPVQSQPTSNLNMKSTIQMSPSIGTRKAVKIDTGIKNIVNMQAVDAKQIFIPAIIVKPISKQNDHLGHIMKTPSVPTVPQQQFLSPKVLHLKPATVDVGTNPITFSELITPPHGNSNLWCKPPAKPIVFPKMTPETPTSTSFLTCSMLTGVNRKILARTPTNDNF